MKVFIQWGTNSFQTRSRQIAANYHLMPAQDLTEEMFIETDVLGSCVILPKKVGGRLNFSLSKSSKLGYKQKIKAKVISILQGSIAVLIIQSIWPDKIVSRNRVPTKDSDFAGHDRRSWGEINKLLLYFYMNYCCFFLTLWSQNYRAMTKLHQISKISDISQIYNRPHETLEMYQLQ